MTFKISFPSRKLACPVIAMIIFAGCQNADEYRNERIAKADKAFKEIKSKKLPQNAVLSLPYCIETALNNNLDLRVYDLKMAVNSEKRTAAALGMLPDVIVTNDISARSNEPGASSYSLESGQQSLEPSKSSEKTENRVRVEFLFSFIDFGLAYFNAVQAKDKTLITEEEKRRAAQNLILDVSRAYFKVAAAQYAMENTEKMLAISDETEKLIEQMTKTKKLPLEKLITEKKTFLLLKRALMEYKRSYENSCIELRALMGYYPKHDLRVDTTGMGKVAELKVPDVELLEEIALIERPELFQLDMERHITAINARKKVLEMFPNVGMFTDFTNSTNKYLYNQSWWEIGVRAAYRLLRVPQQMGEFAATETEMDQIDVQVTALSVGILAQVRIAHANLIEVKSRYQLAEELFETYKAHEKIKEAQAQSAGAISQIELNRIKMETAQKDIERTDALGNYYLAYFRLLNSVGLETLDKKSLEEIKKRINDNFVNTQEEELEKISGYKASLCEYREEIDDINKKILTFNKDLKSKDDAEVKSCTEDLKELEKEKAAIEALLNNSESTVNDHIAKQARYVAAIDLIAAENGKAPSPAENLQMETQNQTGKSKISFTEFSPEATKNINMQAQENAGNTNINVLEYDPNTQKNIQMQTQKDAGNNNINFQEFGSKLNTEDDKVDNQKMNNELDRQLEKK